ncbi:MAG TPA: hypothetical protein VL401_03065 [Alphaproteobacteria bacterium]|jgi:hypothetical protein|nr:hypothetical protein [Alphaproteobacteria bacterium]
MKKIVLFSIIFLISIVIMVVGVYLFRNNQLKSSDFESSSWKTYENQDLGFSFKYPENIKTDLINPNMLRLRDLELIGTSEIIGKEQFDASDYKFDSTIEIKTNSENLDLKKFIEKEQRIINGKITDSAEIVGTPIIRQFSLEQKDIDGKSAYLFQADPCSICRTKTYKIYIKYSPNKIITFEKDTDVLGLYDQIFSTFKFTK